jgi:hypothetical protein
VPKPPMSTVCPSRTTESASAIDGEILLITLSPVQLSGDALNLFA